MRLGMQQLSARRTWLACPHGKSSLYTRADAGFHKYYRAVVIAVIVAIKTGSTASRGLGGRTRTKDDASCLIKHHVISHENAMWVPKPAVRCPVYVETRKIIAEIRIAGEQINSHTAKTVHHVAPVFMHMCVHESALEI